MNLLGTVRPVAGEWRSLSVPSGSWLFRIDFHFLSPDSVPILSRGIIRRVVEVGGVPLHGRWFYFYPGDDEFLLELPQLPPDLQATACRLETRKQYRRSFVDHTESAWEISVYDLMI